MSDLTRVEITFSSYRKMQKNLWKVQCKRIITNKNMQININADFWMFN
ncbi:hypothetical protein URH17368_2856 [Alicyclobacillus hesperidum URH17-3-68]|nr:hypothetical protein URH17368_2856 [Alicyclobacillus hesperidum URH17-3-68]